MARSLRRLGLFLSFSVAVIAPSSALACSVLAKVFTSSLPANGAQGAPIDVAPIIRGHWRPDSVVWEAEDGAQVAFDLISGPQRPYAGRVAELVPHAPLRPNTRYFIRASVAGEVKESIAFITGEALAEKVSAEAPLLSMSVLDGITGNMCYGTSAVVCASVDGAALLEVSGADGAVLDRDVFEGSIFTYVTDPHCVRVWARSASGQLSAPRQLCGDTLAPRPVRDELNGHYECRGGEFRLRDGEPSEGGNEDATTGTGAGDHGSSSEVVAAGEPRDDAERATPDASATEIGSEAANGCSISARKPPGRPGLFLSTGVLATLALSLRRRRQ